MRMKRLLSGPHAHLAILAGLTALGAALRSVNIGAEPFWGDEALSLDIVLRFLRSPGEMLRYLKDVEIHPPLYYLLLAPWVKWFGSGELAVRSLSLLFGTATIPLTYLLARRLFSRVAPALAAAGIIAVMPFQLEFGQEARPYAMVCFFSVAAALALWTHLRSGKRLPLVLYALAVASAMYFHYSGLFTAAALAGWWAYEIAFHPRSGGRWGMMYEWLLAQAAVFLLFAWWLDAFLFKLLLSKLSLTGLPDRNLPDVRPVDFFGETISQVIWTVKSRELLPVELFAQAVFVAAALWAAFRTLGERPPKDEERLALGFAGWLGAAVLVLFLFSPASLNYAPLFERHVIFATVPFALLLGWLAGRLTPKRSAVVLALFAVSILPRAADVLGNDALWDRYHSLKPVAAHINEHWKPGDLVLMTWHFTRSDFNHFLRPEISAVALLPPEYGGDYWDSRETLGFIENELQFRIARVNPADLRDALDRVMRAHEPKRVWLYGFTTDYYAVHAWFEERDWRHALIAPARQFQLDLYVKP